MDPHDNYTFKEAAQGFLICVVVLLVIYGFASLAQAGSTRTCFPAGSWGGNDAERPCVQVTRLYEDGSFSYRVSDANGVERYSADVGTPDH